MLNFLRDLIERARVLFPSSPVVVVADEVSAFDRGPARAKSQCVRGVGVRRMTRCDRRGGGW